MSTPPDPQDDGAAQRIDEALARRNPRTRVTLRLEEVVMAGCMAGLALITFGNVVTRYLTNVSFAFTEEYSVLLMVVMTLVGASVAFASGRHIRIGYFADRARPARSRSLAVLSGTAGVAMFAILAIIGAYWVYDSWRFEVMTPGLGHPEWLYTIWLPVLAGVIILRLVGWLLRVGRTER